MRIHTLEEAREQVRRDVQEALAIVADGKGWAQWGYEFLTGAPLRGLVQSNNDAREGRVWIVMCVNKGDTVEDLVAGFERQWTMQVGSPVGAVEPAPVELGR